MIRINLLGIKRQKTRARMPSVSMEGAKATALFVIMVLAAVGWLGFRFTYLTRENVKLRADLDTAQAEQRRLQAVKVQVNELEKKKQLLNRKISIIEDLKNKQTGPVTMLNALAATVESSGTIWLTSFTNDGSKVSLDGVAGNVTTVADFITNLKRSGYFTNVEIKESYEDDTKSVSTFVFSITADIGGAAAPAPASPGAPGTRPPGAKT